MDFQDGVDNQAGLVILDGQEYQVIADNLVQADILDGLASRGTVVSLVIVVNQGSQGGLDILVYRVQVVFLGILVNQVTLAYLDTAVGLDK